jgi:dihydrofolate reductase
MRKIINSAFVSLDGVTEDPRSWATFDPDSGEEAAQALQALDGMIMGRGTYEYFADVMPNQTGPYGDAINAIRKYVFSSTLESADWNNSTIIREDVVAAVTKLKQEDGGDLMMYGYGRLSRTCSSTTSSKKSGSPFTQYSPPGERRAAGKHSR